MGPLLRVTSMQLVTEITARCRHCAEGFTNLPSFAPFNKPLRACHDRFHLTDRDLQLAESKSALGHQAHQVAYPRQEPKTDRHRDLDLVLPWQPFWPACF